MKTIMNVLIGIALFSTLLVVAFIGSLIYAIQDTIQWRKNRLKDKNIHG
jgi:type II secretory pathway component PulJ